MGAKIVALAVQSESGAASTVESTNAQFPILADSDHVVADQFGVYNLHSDGEAASTVFIISQDGHIVWEEIPTTSTRRVPSETILENLPG